MLAGCRALKITFGAALPVIAQLAHARFLHRLSSQGLISDREWDERLRQPTHFAGPANLRPYLSPDWYRNGGDREICLAIHFWFLKMPFLPISQRAKKEGRLPPFDELLSKGRFKLRADMVKSRVAGALGHPLYLDMAALRTPTRVDSMKKIALNWRNGKDPKEVAEPLPPFTYSNGGSSVGNVRDMTFIPTLAVSISFITERPSCAHGISPGRQ